MEKKIFIIYSYYDKGKNDIKKKTLKIISDINFF
jgi:hypothetical protein